MKQETNMLVLLFFIFQFHHILCQIELTKTNVLFLIIDDFRSPAELTVNLPNIENLAASGIEFKNTYSQQALCAPSRNSLLTSRRPDSLRLYDFYSYWRESVGNFTTLPQIFKENGYETYSIGKVYHPGKSSNFTDDYPFSWSKPPYHPPTEKYKDANVCKDRTTRQLQKNLICPVNLENQPEKTLPDLQSLSHAKEILNKSASCGKPFFLAIGFHKPHIPLKFPKKYMGKVPRAMVHPPAVPYIPVGMPQVAWHPWTDVRSRDDIRSLNISFPYGTMPTQWSRKIRRSYMAATLYIDDLIGELLSYVNYNDTIVVLTSDHGWSLGENGLWAKYSNFEAALKVPLIFRVPGMERKIIHTPVELLDIFPTLVDLTRVVANVPACESQYDKNLLCFQGKSLVPFMENQPYTSDDLVAISQYPRPSHHPQKNSDKPHLKDIQIMGYSIRTKRFRYTKWIGFNHTAFHRDWSNIYGVELYDHLVDPRESINLYLAPKYTEIRLYLSQLLISKVEHE